MKPLAIALMIAALALPAAAFAEDHHGHGHDSRPADRGHDRGGPPPGGGYGGSPRYGPPQRNGPPPGYGGDRSYGDDTRYRGRDYGGDYGPRGGPGRWARGQFFPPAYRGDVVNDYYRYHLRRPPPGYYWYRSGDDFILAALASGLIFEVVPGDY